MSVPQDVNRKSTQRRRACVRNKARDRHDVKRWCLTIAQRGSNGCRTVRRHHRARCWSARAIMRSCPAQVVAFLELACQRDIMHQPCQVRSS